VDIDRGQSPLRWSGTLKGLDLYFEGPDPGVDYYLDDVEVLPPGPPRRTECLRMGGRQPRTRRSRGLGRAGLVMRTGLTAHPLIRMPARPLLP